MILSIVIPTYNEAENIASLIHYLKKHKKEYASEIIVVDAGSVDQTFQIAEQAGARVVLSPQKGRAAQMNYGASLAKGDVLYFVHADTFPPSSYTTDITTALAEGYDLGRYKTKFLSQKPILRLNEWFTRFDLFICMGGDQTLFIKKAVFDELHGFQQEMLIMEEYEFCKRARDRRKRYKIMGGSAMVSARKYEKNSWLQVQLANYKVVSMYKKGLGQQQLIAEYKKRLKF